jgi:hypothetical protein
MSRSGEMRTRFFCPSICFKFITRLHPLQPRPHSPGARVLHGRNAVLGALSDAVMTCVVGISDTRAMVCSEKGDICLLDEDGQRLTRVADAEFGVSCIAVDPDCQSAWIAGKNGNIRYVLVML